MTPLENVRRVLGPMKSEKDCREVAIAVLTWARDLADLDVRGALGHAATMAKLAALGKGIERLKAAAHETPPGPRS